MKFKTQDPVPGQKNPNPPNPDQNPRDPSRENPIENRKKL